MTAVSQQTMVSYRYAMYIGFCVYIVAVDYGAVLQSTACKAQHAR